MRIEISPHARVLCAVSGGADSMALLHCLHGRYAAGGLGALTAAHFNHGLRPEADEEERFVRAFCAERSIDCLCEHGDLREHIGGAGLEEAARAARYDFLYRAAEQVGADTIVTAHQADDNLETILMNLARGAGLEGLCGIPPRRGALYRPLLHVTRREIEDYLRRHGVAHVEDASNSDLRFRRNLLRHQVLPVLRELNPHAAQAAGQAAELLRRDAELLESLTDREMAKAEPLPDGVGYPAAQLLDLPDALRGRVLRRLCRQAGLYSAEHRHIEALLALCRRDHPRASLDLPGGLTARRVYDQLVIGQPPAAQRLNFTLEIGQSDPNIHKSFNTFSVASDTITGSLTVRTRQSGDRFKPAGRGVTKSVKKWMIEKKIPRHLRDSLPVVTDERGIVAIAGLGVAEQHAPRNAADSVTLTVYSE